MYNSDDHDVAVTMLCGGDNDPRRKCRSVGTREEQNAGVLKKRHPTGSNFQRNESQSVVLFTGHMGVRGGHITLV